eukprot:TRINITY_DN6141_c0_g1_i3.p1 TRINITY_DN6141_c0_g1~~TRINITY_DN6141_c0_g1_i3.p1  ORF type:complete len:374 (-),score=97.09 TRINITY_DN6141_c0_g1_i3:72-1151(-)
MSYNGVGLSTPRGSGTSGYIQSNKAAIRNKRKPIRKTKETFDIRKTPQMRQANKELVIYNKKREIEVELVRLRDAMEEKGTMTEDEMDDKIDSLRATKLALLESELQMAEQQGSLSALDQKTVSGWKAEDKVQERQNANHQSHERDNIKEAMNARVAQAFGINREQHKWGQAFDEEIQAKKKLERQEIAKERKKQYELERKEEEKRRKAYEKEQRKAAKDHGYKGRSSKRRSRSRSRSSSSSRSRSRSSSRGRRRHRRKRSYSSDSSRSYSSDSRSSGSHSRSSSRSSSASSSRSRSRSRSKSGSPGHKTSRTAEDKESRGRKRSRSKDRRSKSRSVSRSRSRSRSKSVEKRRKTDASE